MRNIFEMVSTLINRFHIMRILMSSLTLLFLLSVIPEHVRSRPTEINGVTQDIGENIPVNKRSVEGDRNSIRIGGYKVGINMRKFGSNMAKSQARKFDSSMASGLVETVDGSMASGLAKKVDGSIASGVALMVGSSMRSKTSGTIDGSMISRVSEKVDGSMASGVSGIVDSSLVRGASGKIDSSLSSGVAGIADSSLVRGASGKIDSSLSSGVAGIADSSLVRGASGKIDSSLASKILLARGLSKNVNDSAASGSARVINGSMVSDASGKVDGSLASGVAGIADNSIASGGFEVNDVSIGVRRTSILDGAKASKVSESGSVVLNSATKVENLAYQSGSSALSESSYRNNMKNVAEKLNNNMKSTAMGGAVAESGGISVKSSAISSSGSVRSGISSFLGETLPQVNVEEVPTHGTASEGFGLFGGSMLNVGSGGKLGEVLSRSKVDNLGSKSVTGERGKVELKSATRDEDLAYESASSSFSGSSYGSKIKNIAEGLESNMESAMNGKIAKSGGILARRGGILARNRGSASGNVNSGFFLGEKIPQVIVEKDRNYGVASGGSESFGGSIVSVGSGGKLAEVLSRSSIGNFGLKSDTKEGGSLELKNTGNLAHEGGHSVLFGSNFRSNIRNVAEGFGEIDDSDDILARSGVISSGIISGGIFKRSTGDKISQKMNFLGQTIPQGTVKETASYTK